MKINLSDIEGYAEMTPEQKVAALEAHEFGTDYEQVKNALNKANSQAADMKRQLREKMSADEKAAQERTEKEKAMLEELEQLRKEKSISAYKAKYLELGYSAELAEKTAAAMADGDFETVFANAAKHSAARESAVKAALLNSQPGLSVGRVPETKDDSELSDAEYYAKHYR